MDVQIAGPSGEITGIIEGGPSTRRASKDAAIEADLADFSDIEEPSSLEWEDHYKPSYPSLFDDPLEDNDDDGDFDDYIDDDDEEFSATSYPGPEDDLEPVHDFSPLGDEIDSDEGHLSRTMTESPLNVGLDIAGLVPGIGEVADVANALLYASKGEHLLAGLSLISVIPALGDVVGKGGKLALWLEKISPKLAKNIATFAPKVSESINLIKQLVAENKGLIKKVLEAVKSQSEENQVAKKLSPHLGKIEQALEIFAKKTPEESLGEARDLDDPDFFGDEPSEDTVSLDGSILDQSVLDAIDAAKEFDDTILGNVENELPPEEEFQGHAFANDEEWFVESKAASLRERLRKIIRECVCELNSEELQHSQTGFADMSPSVVSEEEEGTTVDANLMVRRALRKALGHVMAEWPSIYEDLKTKFPNKDGASIMNVVRGIESSLEKLRDNLQIRKDLEKTKKAAQQAMARNPLLVDFIPVELGGKFVS